MIGESEILGQCQTDSYAQGVGILLTGGESKRFGENKTAQILGNETIATWAAKALMSVCATVFEAGHGITELPQIPCTTGEGPLQAIALSTIRLLETGYLKDDQGALILAGDMPLIDSVTLSIIARWPGTSSVVPVVNHRAQYLAARWSSRSLKESINLTQAGIRTVRTVLHSPETQWLSIDKWAKNNGLTFLDLDTQKDFELAKALIALKPLQKAHGDERN